MARLVELAEQPALIPTEVKGIWPDPTGPLKELLTEVFL
jgi:hypothetical protein